MSRAIHLPPLAVRYYSKSQFILPGTAGRHLVRGWKRRQPDRNRGPVSEGALNRDLPPVLVDDLIDDAHAQAGAARAKGAERFEDTLDLFLIHANAGVAEDDFDLPVKRPRD